MKKTKLIYVLAIVIAISSCKKAMTVSPKADQETTISAFVGGGTAIFFDGIGTKAGFVRPTSMVIDASGNIFVADGNARIRKVTPKAEVTTFAGGVIGSVDGTGTAAQFGNGNNPITIDAQNNLYVVDRNNSSIRKITPTGVVTTIAGAPGRAASDGPILTAGIGTDIQDVTIDNSNNIYFIDNSKGIRKVSADGIISTVLKLVPGISTYGSIASATIAGPTSIAADNAGNIYVASRGTNQSVIVKIGIDGIVSQYAGNSAGYNVNVGALPARFGQIINMTIDKAGNFYLADVVNNTFTLITSDGFVKAIAGIPYSTGGPFPFIPGPVAKTSFPDVKDVAIDPSGIIYVMENSGSSIRKIVTSDIPTPPTQNEIDKATWNKPTNWK